MNVSSVAAARSGVHNECGRYPTSWAWPLLMILRDEVGGCLLTCAVISLTDYERTTIC